MNADVETRVTLRQTGAELAAEAKRLRADSVTLEARGFRQIAARLEQVATWRRPVNGRGG